MPIKVITSEYVGRFHKYDGVDKQKMSIFLYFLDEVNTFAAVNIKDESTHSEIFFHIYVFIQYRNLNVKLQSCSRGKIKIDFCAILRL